MNSTALAALRAGSLLTLLAPAALADVLLVDVDDPSAAHHTIQHAVDAAEDGDTVLIRAPFETEYRYPGFVIDGKSISVRGEGRPLLLTGPVHVRNLGLGDEVVLQGLSMNLATIPARGQLSDSGHPVAEFHVPDTSGPGLRVSSSQGAVRVQDCNLQGSVGERVWAGLQLSLAYDVVLVDCRVYGTTPPDYGETAGAAAQIVASRLAAYGSCFEGGAGWLETSDGGVGVSLLQRSALWLDGCEIRGGEGARTYCAFYPCYSVSGDGGDGLVVQTGSVCHETSCEIHGGVGGLIDEGLVGHAFGSPGQDGADVVGALQSDPTTHFDFDVEGVALAAGAPASITITGLPGESARVAIARGGGFRFFGTDRGTMGVSEFEHAAGFLALGTIPASGVLESTISLPSPATATESETLFLQVALDGAGSFRLSAVRTVFVDGLDVPSNSIHRIVRVDPMAAPGGDGTSWSEAFTSIDEALRVLPWTPGASGVEVWLRSGVHLPPRVEGPFVGHGCRIVGGFGGTEASAAEADPVAHPTILDGDRLGDGSVAPNDTDNATSFLNFGSERLRMASHGSTCEGVTLRNAVRGPLTAAMRVLGDTTVRECQFVQNHVTAIRHAEGHLRLDRTRFQENRVHYYGASIHSEYEPYSSTGGGSSIEAVSCEFLGNRSTHSATIRVEGREFVRLIGSTFHGNEAWIGSFGAQAPGVLTLEDTPAASLIGCILSDNSPKPSAHYPSPTPQVGVYYDSALHLSYCCVPDLDPAWPGQGNVIAPPGYVDPVGPNGVAGDGDEDLRLAPLSPCIDAGDSLAFGVDDLLDVAGRPRFADDPGVADSGTGTARVVDIGAHER